MITQGYGQSTGLVTFGMWTKSLVELIEEIIEELRSPLDLGRLCMIEQLLNNLQTAIVTYIATKQELAATVRIYQPPIDALKLRIKDLEERVEQISLEADRKDGTM